MLTPDEDEIREMQMLDKLQLKTLTKTGDDANVYVLFRKHD